MCLANRCTRQRCNSYPQSAILRVYRALPNRGITAPSFCGRSSEFTTQALQGPARVFRNHHVFIATHLLENGHEAFFIAVAERDRDIAAQAVEPCALHR